MNNIKYKIGSIVLAYEPTSNLILEVKIVGITHKVFESYEICTYSCLTNKGVISGIPEPMIFKDRDDLIDWSTKLAFSKSEPFNNNLIDPL